MEPDKSAHDARGLFPTENPAIHSVAFSSDENFHINVELIGSRVSKFLFDLNALGLIGQLNATALEVLLLLLANLDEAEFERGRMVVRNVSNGGIAKALGRNERHIQRAMSLLGFVTRDRKNSGRKKRHLGIIFQAHRGNGNRPSDYILAIPRRCLNLLGGDKCAVPFTAHAPSRLPRIRGGGDRAFAVGGTAYVR